MDVGFLFVFLVGVICRTRNAKCVRMKGVLFFYSCSCVVWTAELYKCRHLRMSCVVVIIRVERCVNI